MGVGILEQLGNRRNIIAVSPIETEIPDTTARRRKQFGYPRQRNFPTGYRKTSHRRATRNSITEFLQVIIRIKLLAELNFIPEEQEEMMIFVIGNKETPQVNSKEKDRAYLSTLYCV